MPCECEIDPERCLVKVRASGAFTYDDAMATRLKFTSNPAFSQDFFQLYDLREVTIVAITASEIAELAKAPIFAPRSRRAIVCARVDIYGLSRMFAIYREINHGREQIEVFKSIDAAEAWLGLKPSRQRPA